MRWLDLDWQVGGAREKCAEPDWGDPHKNSGIVGELCFLECRAPCWGIQSCPTTLSFLHLLQGSLGHMTCILVRFPGAPRPCEEEGARTGCHPGLQGRRWVSSRSSAGRVVGRGTPIVLDFFSELCSSAQEPPSLNKVVRTLASEDIPDLPPGGGLYCK